MRVDVDNNDVVLYMQCPHCKKGWYGKVKYYELEYFKDKEGNVCDDVIGPFGNMYLKSYIVEGLNDTDVTKEITCLNCGKPYTVINSLTGGTDDTTMLMDEFIAKAVTTVKGS